MGDIFCCTLGYVPPYQICANLSNSALPPPLSLLYRAVCSWLRRRRRHQRAFRRKGGFFCARTKEGGKRRTELFTSSKRNLPSYTSCKHVRSTYIVHLVIREYPFPPLALEENPLIFRALLAVSLFFPLLSSSSAVARRILMRGKRRIKRVGGRRGKTGDQYFKKWKRVRNSPNYTP